MHFTFRHTAFAAIILTATMLVATPTGTACEPVELAKVVASDGAAFDRLGITVAIDGNTAVAGAYLHSHGGTSSSGAAYVYELQGEQWVQTVKLVPSTPHNGQWFGVWVAIEGDRIVVGAQNDNEGGTNAGAAYVFVRVDGSWIEEAKLVADDASPGQWAGHRVSISGPVIAVTAQLDDDGGTNAGAVYVYRFANGSWSQEAKLIASDPSPGAEFGTECHVNGDTIVVGARRADDIGTNSGAAYAFVYENRQWVQQTKFDPQGLASGDEFGFAVAVDGDVAVIGARLDNEAGNNAGAAYVFRRDANGDWSQEAKLIGSDTATFDVLGETVAIRGDRILLGARQHGLGGAAYLFQFSDGAWTEVAKLTGSQVTGNHFFGIAVSISEDRAMVGANLDDEVAEQGGAAYIFDLNCEGVLGDLNGDGVVDVSDLLILLAAWGPCADPDDCPADLNGDGVVDVSDLLILLSNWGVAP